MKRQAAKSPRPDTERLGSGSDLDFSSPPISASQRLCVQQTHEHFAEGIERQAAKPPRPDRRGDGWIDRANAAMAAGARTAIPSISTFSSEPISASQRLCVQQTRERFADGNERRDTETQRSDLGGDGWIDRASAATIAGAPRVVPSSLCLGDLSLAAWRLGVQSSGGGARVMAEFARLIESMYGGQRV